MKKPQPYQSKTAAAAVAQDKPQQTVHPESLGSWRRFHLKDRDKNTPELPFTIRTANDKGKEMDVSEWLKFRILPNHPTKNPDGYIKTVTRKLFPKGSRNVKYFLDPESLPLAIRGSEDTFVTKLVKEFDEKVMTNPDLESWWLDIDMNLLSNPQNEFSNPRGYQDAQFKKDWVTFCTDLWVEYVVPAVMYATCEEKTKVGSAYKNYVNYKPNTKSLLPRLIHLGNWMTTRRLIEGIEIEEDVDAILNRDPEEPFQGEIKLNSEHFGQLVKMRKTQADKPGYEIDIDSSMPAGPLPKAIREKLEPSDDPEVNKVREANYPDVLSWYVTSRLPSDADIRNLIASSSLGPVLERLGVLVMPAVSADNISGLEEEIEVPF